MGDITEKTEPIYLINTTSNKKNRVRSKILTEHGFVPSAGVEPARFPTGV